LAIAAEAKAVVNEARTETARASAVAQETAAILSRPEEVPGSPPQAVQAMEAGATPAAVETTSTPSETEVASPLVAEAEDPLPVEEEPQVSGEVAEDERPDEDENEPAAGP
jgi:hypothetical protein